MEGVVHRSTRADRVTSQHERRTRCSVAFNRLEYILRYARRLVDQEEQINAAVSTHRLSVRDSESKDAAPVIPRQPGPRIYGESSTKRDAGMPLCCYVPRAKLFPQDLLHLPGTGRCHDHLALRSSNYPPQRQARERRRLTDLVPRPTGDTPVRHDCAHKLSLPRPTPHPENLVGEEYRIFTPPIRVLPQLVEL